MKDNAEPRHFAGSFPTAAQEAVNAFADAVRVAGGTARVAASNGNSIQIEADWENSDEIDGMAESLYALGEAGTAVS